MKTSRFFWWYWRLLIVLGFGVPEAWAIAHHQPWNTFSNQWWTWAGTFSEAHASAAPPVIFLGVMIIVEAVIFATFEELRGSWHLRQLALLPFLLYLVAHLVLGASGNPWLWLAALPAIGVAIYSGTKREGLAFYIDKTQYKR